MSTLATLATRIDRLSKQLSPAIQGPIFDYALFTVAEQARLDALPLDQLADRHNRPPIGKFTASLTQRELDAFYYFLELQEALCIGDTSEAAYWRLCLLPPNELDRLFRSLNISKLIARGDDIQAQRRHITYTLSRFNYQFVHETEIQALWVDYYQKQGWI